MELKNDVLQELAPRLSRLALVLLGCLAVLVGRLYYLQGVRGNFYRFFSEENSIRETKLSAARGLLKDRNGIILADNRVAFDLVLVPQYVLDPPAVLQTLARHLNISPDFLEKKWQRRLIQPAYQPISLLEDVSLDTVSWVKSHQNPWGILGKEIDLRGVDIHLRYERDYLSGEMASHVLGYIGEIDNRRLEEYQKKWPGHYRVGDAVGVRGLEEVWDLEVRGKDGYVQKVVNAVGREVAGSGLDAELINQKAIPGRNLQLTLDARLQQKAQDYFRDKEGAAVALDPKTGAVLLLYSAPALDLNRLSGRRDPHYWEQIATSPKHYLYNRAIQGAYPPGSVYKIITGTAGLHEGMVDKLGGIYCDGGLRYGGREYGCWRKTGHGSVDFYRGLVSSCDVYFYRLGLMLGVDRLAKYAQAFGLGAPTGIGLPNERSGLVPTREWKRKVYHDEWYEGENLVIAIGQGPVLLTPIQAATMIGMVANGGKKLHPYLVEKMDDQPVEHETPEPVELLQEPILRKVRETLAGVVSDPQGTAHSLTRFNIPIGGKTGTAQVVGKEQSCHGEDCGDHAWFVAFAPVADPQIAIAVLVEHGGHGSSAAAPLAGELIQTYLGKNDGNKKTF